MMKKLTKKILADILKEYFWLNSYSEITFTEKRIYINYFSFTIVLWYGSKYGWNISLNGQISYAVVSYSVKLCEELEKSFIYYDNSKD